MIPTNGVRHVILAMAVFRVQAQSARLARVDRNLDQERHQEFHGNVAILLAWRSMGQAFCDDTGCTMCRSGTYLTLGDDRKHKCSLCKASCTECVS